MRYSKLTMLNFMALCCVLGICTKKLLNPFANLITDALHIPGGVSTGFSIMFLVIGAEVVKCTCGNRQEGVLKYCGTLMGAVQGFLSLALGRVGSMGILMPLGFIATGVAIDLVYTMEKWITLSRIERMVFANSLAAFAASFTANLIVFRLQGPVFLLYLSVSATSGAIYGFLGSVISARIMPVISGEWMPGHQSVE